MHCISIEHFSSVYIYDWNIQKKKIYLIWSMALGIKMINNVLAYPLYFILYFSFVDISKFGICPARAYLQLVVCKLCQKSFKCSSLQRHYGKLILREFYISKLFRNLLGLCFNLLFGNVSNLLSIVCFRCGAFLPFCMRG